jgi:hypothetical protein
MGPRADVDAVAKREIPTVSPAGNGLTLRCVAGLNLSHCCHHTCHFRSLRVYMTINNYDELCCSSL